jgi:hypothetical protein
MTWGFPVETGRKTRTFPAPHRSRPPALIGCPLRADSSPGLGPHWPACDRFLRCNQNRDVPMHTCRLTRRNGTALGTFSGSRFPNRLADRRVRPWRAPLRSLLTIIERSATLGSLLIVPSSSLRAPSSSSELVRVTHYSIWSNSTLARLTRDAEKPSVN